MRITINKVGEIVKERSYFYVLLGYNRDGKDEVKKIFSFAEKTYSVLKEAKAGEVYDVKLAKNKSGYWEWVDVAKATEDSPSKAAGSTAYSTRSGSWETPEERARRQTLIVRQSSLAQAVAHQPKATLEVVLEEASAFEAWVNRE